MVDDAQLKGLFEKAAGFAQIGLLKEARVAVSILSANSVHSDHARREIHFTIQSKKPIVPVLLSKDQVLPKVWQFYLSELQHLFADGPIGPALPKIQEAVARLVDRSRHQAEHGDEEDVLRRCNYQQNVDPARDRLGLPLREFREGTATVEGSSYVLHSRPGEFSGHRMDALPITSDFVLEARIRKTSGPDEKCFGFEFGASYPGDYYQFLLNGSNTLRIARHLESGWTDLSITQAQHLINRAHGANLLKVARKGESAHVFVNDLHVASTSDFTVRTGRPGLRILSISLRRRPA